MKLETQERILKIKKARLKLAERIADVAECRNLTDGKRGQGTSKRIYLGTEDELILFRRIIATLGLEIDYDVEDVDGEIEVVVREVR